jgi:hypothetical protein
MPTSGVAPAAKTEQQVQEIQQQHPKEEEVAPAAEVAEQREEVIKPKTAADILKKYHSVIDEKFSNKLYDYVIDNREALGISNNGEIYLNIKHKHMGAQEGSNFHNVLDYLLGRSDSVTDKKSTSVLGKRIMAKEEIKELMDQSKQAQKGEGRKRKKYVVDLKPAAIKTSKTRGLARGFKPVLWNKIPV